MIQRRTFLHQAAAVAATAATAGMSPLPGSVWAQSPANRPMKIVIGFPPGATSDLLARTIADRLGPALGTTVMVDNKPGAGTIIASQLVVKAPPDGTTWFINLALHFQNQLLYKNLPYDIFKDFANVTDICYSPVMLIVSGTHPAKTVKEYIEWGKARKMSYASWGNGSTGHILNHMFSKQHGLDATHVPYKGGAAAVTDLIGGQVDSIFIDLGSTRQHILSGRLRALAVCLDKRMPQLPDLPTMEEAGVNGMNIAGFYGMYAPAATPKDIVARVSTEVQKILKMPDVAQRFYDQAFIPGGSDPEAFTQMLRREYARWEPIVKATGVQLEM